VVKLSLRKGLKHLSIIALAALVLYGCGSTPKRLDTQKINAIALGNITQSVDQYLVKALNSNGITKQAHQLNALRAALLSNEAADKLAIANLMTTLTQQSMLSDDHKLEWQWLQSISLNQAMQPQQALTILMPQTSWKIPHQRWFSFFQYQASLQHAEHLDIQAISSLIAAQQYATSATDNHQLSLLIWPLISQLDDDELNDVVGTNSQLKGWKALATLTKASMHSPQVLRQQLTQWAIDHPQHMAVDDLPENLIAAVNIQAYAPQKIALLLPLSGRYARLGEAVQHGIVSNVLAHNSSQQILTFDTQALGAQTAHQQAIEQGAEFIIGPLLKNNVAQVSLLTQSVPTLFLNSSITPLLDQQYSFSLSKDEEAIQGIEHLYSQGKKHPVIVAPDNAQGHKIARQFNEKWLELNQHNPLVEPIEAFYFGNDSELKSTIERLFETDKSQNRINFMRLLVGVKMKSETRSRRDIDAVYLVANPQQTGMLMPSVEVTVSAFAPQVAVYVGSSGNDSLDSAQNRRHLNQLTVSDMPWFIERPAQLPPLYIKKLWPNIKQSHMRFFAMGHDAYGLIARLAQMQYFEQFTLDGLSGTLSLTAERDIIRKMAWAQYQRGRLVKQ